jgi:integrase
MASVSVRPKYRKDGTLIGYYCRWYDPHRRPQRVERSLRTRDEGEAHRKAHELESEERLGLYDPWTGKRAQGSDISLTDAVVEYLIWCERRQAARSVKIKKSRLRKLQKHMRAGARLADVTPEDVERVMHRLKGRNDPADTDGTRPPASAHTRKNYYASMCGLFSWAVEQGHVRESVMDRVRAPADADAERVVLVPAEVERIKVALMADGETNGHRKNRAFLADVIDFACATGLRVGEVCALNWEHVELTERGGRLTGTVAVENYRGGKRRSSSNRTKTRKRRRIALFPRAAEVLVRLEPNRTGKGTAGPGVPVFRGARGGRLDKQVPTRLFTEYVELARLTKPATFHSCRHTFITWCANELGLPIPVVQRLAGHQTVTTTMGYVHTSGDTVMEAVERSLALAGLATPDEQRRRASSASAETAAWMAGAEAYEAYLERRKEGSCGEYMGNAPLATTLAGRSGASAEGAKAA